MRELNRLESEVLDKLFAGSDPALTALRRQAAIAKVESKRLTGVGFYVTFTVPEGEAPAPVRASRISFGDVGARIPGLEHGAGFEVFIENGKLRMLEGYSYGEPWPDVVGDFELFYLHVDRRSVAQAIAGE
jgi:hypothetical protein